MQNETKRHYLDYNATTPLLDKVVSAIKNGDLLNQFGNASSIHWGSRNPKSILRETRRSFAEALGCNSSEIIFTSGASESNNTVIKSVFQKYKNSEKNHYLVSAVEHPSVMKTFNYLKQNGALVDVIPVNRDGFIDLEFIKSKTSKKTALVSVMLANNETGNIFPIQEIARMAHAVGALMHTDAVQALGKMKINLQELNVDYATFSAHKVYSLKGCGVTYVRRGSPYENLIFGGGQEKGRRGGTENTLSVASLGIVLECIEQIYNQYLKISDLRNHMESLILSEIPEVKLTGKLAPRTPNTSSLVFKDVDGESLLMALDIAGFAVSTGAACSSGNPEPSPVLLAMGLSKQEAQSSLRVSLGINSTLEQMDLFIETLKQIVSHLRCLKKQENQSKQTTSSGELHV